MPALSILASYNKSIDDINILENYILSSLALDARYQHIIGEVIMLRLFSIVESTISEFALKLACGANYKNGNSPIVLLRSRSMQNAYSNMLSYNRRRALRYLRWTKASFVKESIEHVLDISDTFYTKVNIYGNLINEMRIVRNHIAHRSTSTRSEYITLLRLKYGGNPNLTVGAYLTSTARNSTPNIRTYIASTRIVLHEISEG
ncbi:MAG TPA: hypothetical protein VHB54_06285 [Mucilaginibacter sp.]|nr:hypothetical protein [Mucilaginibacter sp.]